MTNRNRFFISLILIVFGFSILLIKTDFLRLFYFKNEASYTLVSFSITIISLIVGLMGATRLIFDYLQGKISSSKYSDDYLDLKNKFEKLEDFISSIEKDTKITEETTKIISDKVSSLTNDEIIKTIEQRFGDNIYEKFKLNIIAEELKQIKYRLDFDMRRISRTSSINLTLGFATTIFAITYLSYSLLLTDDTTKIVTQQISDKADIKIILAIFLVKFLPRLSVSIFIELFSFFFLRMYKKNLEDIKYLNNERTNVELKLLALSTALSNKDNESLKSILVELSKTERNFILKKGESTAEIEKSRLESNFYKETLEHISKIFKK